MDPRDVVRTKRDGGALSAEQIAEFLAGYVAGGVPDYVASALLMGIFQVGMLPDELVRWTRAMLDSGARLELPRVAGPKADKHSTGGVGDKVSLALAPALAACGVAVPMISGRGLGHTGGTLDKLESIPGLRTQLTRAELEDVVLEAGFAIAAQTAELVPADRKLYALRDATGLVESIPLIASSILSKKLAEGLDALVLDVKFGSGAFLVELDRGRVLGETMLAIARGFELPTRVRYTSMEQPLGVAVGHALEVREALDCLAGAGPPDLRELVVTLGADLLAETGVAVDDARARIAAALDGGTARAAFERGVRAQGATSLELPAAARVLEWSAPASGVLDVADCRRIGLAAAALGGGRRAPGEALDHAVGVLWRARIGDSVRAGDVLAELHHNGRGVEGAREHLAAAVAVDTGRVAAPLVLPG
jgi:pyrimidine-nucleoside phosphorylase